MSLSPEEVALVRRARRLVRHQKRLAPLAYLYWLGLTAYVFYRVSEPASAVALILTGVLFWRLGPQARGAPSYEALVEVLEGQLPPRDPIIAALEPR